MVKTILSLLIATALLAGAAIFESYFVQNKFEKMEVALLALEDKVRVGEAHRTDAEVVKSLWDDEK